MPSAAAVPTPSSAAETPKRHAPLTIRLFGPMAVLRNNEPLPALRTHKGLWLIALLTLRRGAPVDRAWLAETLWSDSFSLQAQYNLRRCLSDLRAALGPEAFRIESPSARTIRLDLSGADVDIEALDDAMRASSRVPPDVQAVERAVALYRGELLEGCTEPWVESDRVRYAESYLGALETLAGLASAAGDATKKIAYLRLAVTAQPEREHTQRSLMQALADLGDAAAVTHTYRTLRVYLRDRLNVEPSRETRALYQTLTDRLAEQPASTPSAVPPERIAAPATAPPAAEPQMAPEPSSGAILPGSSFYVERPVDRHITQAIHRGDGLILIKGPRQIGKTSLIAQTVARLRAEERRVVITDIQALGAAALHSADAFVTALLRNLRGQTARGDAAQPPRDAGAESDAGLLPGEKLERFLENELLTTGSGAAPLVWVLDELDGIFACDFRDEIFALFRSWYNARAFDPTGAWRNLTMVICFATEAHLFITDLNQSPFNVGTRFTLADFTEEEVAVLSERFRTGLPPDELRRLIALLGGHPYLSHRALAGIAARETDLAALEGMADQDGETIFSDHLKRMEKKISVDGALHQAMVALLSGEAPPAMDAGSFHRLRSAGVLTGDTVALAACRCRLYERYLRRRLLATGRSFGV